MVVYHRDPRMHMWGNHGPGGMMHALLASTATSIITRNAYKGFEPRRWIGGELKSRYDTDRIVDLGCGVGTATVGTGVDASAEMIRVARWMNPQCTFVQGDAEEFGTDAAYDAATISFVLHEMPHPARQSTLLNAVRIAPRIVCVTDICPTYTPSKSMLWGEPFLKSYQRHIDKDVDAVARMTRAAATRHVVIPGHVILWMIGAQEEVDDMTRRLSLHTDDTTQAK